jgi:site-specific recombinase
MAGFRPSPWDLTALLNAADPKASTVERHVWVIRLLEWLRRSRVDIVAAEDATPRAVLRLRHLLGVLERNAEHQERVAALLGPFLREVDSAALLADFGFAARTGLASELGRRLRAKAIPLTPATTDLGELFALLFPDEGDAVWLDAIDDATLARIGGVLQTDPRHGSVDWRAPFFDAIMFLASTVRAAGFSPALRRRMSASLLADQPFRQLARAAEQIRVHADEGSEAAVLLKDAQYLRALLETCRRAADSVHEHLDAHGISVDVVFEVDQLRERTHRIDVLLNCVLSPEPAREILHLVVELVRTAKERRSIRALLGRHTSLLARKVAERSAETGAHYITRTRRDWWRMLGAAAGGGAVLGGTTFFKFAIVAAGLTAFWGGLVSGLLYAASFVLIQALGFTLATKQPAMTAPALAERLRDVASDDAVERFVDEVAHLIRSQMAGILGNLATVIPVVVAVQLAADALLGAPLVGTDKAADTLVALSWLGPTMLYAAFTGVLLFASSLAAGWVENWFVWHRLDSAIAWNPSIVARLGAVRAARWSVAARRHVSGVASNVALGLLLGLVPAILQFVSLPLDVRHVTLATGQLFTSVAALGPEVLHGTTFWLAVLGIAATGALNLGVAFLLAFRLALRSRGIRLADRSRIHRAIRARFRGRPLSFLVAPA